MTLEIVPVVPLLAMAAVTPAGGTLVVIVTGPAYDVLAIVTTVRDEAPCAMLPLVGDSSKPMRAGGGLTVRGRVTVRSVRPTAAPLSDRAYAPAETTPVTLTESVADSVVMLGGVITPEIPAVSDTSSSAT
ncbi:MAG: hypothetical protein IPF98_08290 [Gemmatimonadetes bacterium]|nr:hypothetical protein [Gemmatimonadota bacterium]